MKVDGLLHFDERVDHVLRSDDVAQTEARREYLGHRVERDRAFRRKSTHGKRRFFVVVDLTVGIVFKNPEIVFARLFRQELAAFDVDRAARRVLEGRHDVGEASAAA